MRTRGRRPPYDLGRGSSAPLPAPDAKYAFSFDGEMSLAGAAVGTSHVGADVGSFEGKPAWRLSEEMDATPAPMRQHVRLVAWTAADLRVLSEEVFEQEGTKAQVTSLILLTEESPVRRATGTSVPEPADGVWFVTGIVTR